MSKKKDQFGGLIKKYGDIFVTGKDLFEEEDKRGTLSISPMFDIGLNGGLMEGTWTNIAGDSNVGKTTLCMQILANAQKAKRKTVYVDAELKLHKYNMAIEGLNPEEILKISVREDGEPLAAEDYMNAMFDLFRLPEYKGAVCIVDSWSAMSPRNELDGDISGSTRAIMPKLLSNFIRKMQHVVKSQNIIMISVLHYITNTSGYGKLKNADCGVYIQFQASTKIDFKRAAPWEEGGRQIGIIPECTVSRSAKGATGTTINSYIRFGRGIDKVREIIETAESLSLIDKAASWYQLDFLEGNEKYQEIYEKKLQGLQKVQELLESNPDIFAILEKKLRDIL